MGIGKKIKKSVKKSKKIKKGVKGIQKGVKSAAKAAKKDIKRAAAQGKQGFKDLKRGDFKAAAFNLAGAGTTVALSPTSQFGISGQKIQRGVAGLIDLKENKSGAFVKDSPEGIKKAPFKLRTSQFDTEKDAVRRRLRRQASRQSFAIGTSSIGKQKLGGN